MKKLNPMHAFCLLALLSYYGILGISACTKEQVIKTVTAIDVIAQDVCGSGDPLLTCLDKIERSDKVVTARRARMLTPSDAGAE